MPFPEFDFCLVCDAIRPEIGGKVTLLGFYGVAPNVEIAVANPGTPVGLAILAGFPPVQDEATAYQHSITVVKPNGTVLVQTPASKLNVSAAGRGLIAFGFGIQPPVAYGAYPIRVTVNGQVKLDTSIRVRAATNAELAGLPNAAVPAHPAN